MLEGREGCAGGLPRKSSPSNESPALVCFGGAGSDLGGGAFLVEGGPASAVDQESMLPTPQPEEEDSMSDDDEDDDDEEDWDDWRFRPA